MTAGIQDIPIFFIVGRERSGTTLLQVLLDNHPNVVIPTESPFIRHLYGRYAQRAQWNEKSILGFYCDLLEEPYINLWHLDKEKLKHHLLSLRDPSFGTLCKAVYFHSLSAKGKGEVRLIGDKNPQYSLFIPQLLKVFPSAKFVFITRDPRDQVMSMMKVNFERRSVSSLAYRWKYFNREIRGQMRKFPGQFHYVKYEDLICEPSAEVERVCRFLGISYDEGMLSASARAEAYVNSGSLVKEHHQSLLKPIDPAMAYRWKEKMREKDVMIIDAVAGELMERFRYERKYALVPASVWLKAFPGRLYGRLYFSFLNTVYALPYSLRMLLFKKLIMKIFGFWKQHE
jgi:hypothetical protein